MSILYILNLNLYFLLISIMYRIFQIFVTVESRFNNRKYTIIGIVLWAIGSVCILALQVVALYVLYEHNSYEIARKDKFYK